MSLSMWMRLVALRTAFLCVYVLGITSICGSAESATVDPQTCAGARAVDAGVEQLLTATVAGEWIAITVDEPGLLAVQAELKLDVAGVPWLGFGHCSSRATSPIRGFFGHGFVEVREPGTVYLRVGLVDSAASPSDLLLSTHLFIPARGFDKDGEAGSDTEEEEHEILPLRAPSDLEMMVCGDGEPFDDLRVCAQEIEREIPLVGQFDSGSAGLDYDFFTFTVDRARAVQLVVVGLRGRSGTLFDAGGRSLAHREFEDDRMALDAVLVPGRYFIRTEGWGGSDYALHLGASAID